MGSLWPCSPARGTQKPSLPSVCLSSMSGCSENSIDDPVVSAGTQIWHRASSTHVTVLSGSPFPYVPHPRELGGHWGPWESRGGWPESAVGSVPAWTPERPRRFSSGAQPPQAGLVFFRHFLSGELGIYQEWGRPPWECGPGWKCPGVWTPCR